MTLTLILDRAILHIPSRITHRPLHACQISFKSKKLLVHRRTYVGLPTYVHTYVHTYVRMYMYVRTHVRTDGRTFETHVIRSTQKSRTKKLELKIQYTGCGWCRWFTTQSCVRSTTNWWASTSHSAWKTGRQWKLDGSTASSSSRFSSACRCSPPRPSICASTGVWGPDEPPDEDWRVEPRRRQEHAPLEPTRSGWVPELGRVRGHARQTGQNPA